MDESTLLRGLLFGAIGLGFAVYGRRQRAAVPFVCGLGLIGAPYLISNVLLLLLAGVVLMLACYFIRL